MQVVTEAAVPDFDRLIHERIRLGIISALAANESLTFNDLKKLLKTTDGNLERPLAQAGGRRLHQLHQEL